MIIMNFVSLSEEFCFNNVAAAVVVVCYLSGVTA